MKPLARADAKKMDTRHPVDVWSYGGDQKAETTPEVVFDCVEKGPQERF
jgi:hypothetical protein